MRRAGFTLVELLTVIAIIGVLSALLLPAVQASREASRTVQCRSNLKQIGVALLMHHDQRGHFPYGGWGHEWAGVPGRGSRSRQPGGWIYSLLPYLEQATLHAWGGASNPDGFTARLRTPMPLFTCPTRRTSGVWPVSPFYPYMYSPKPFGSAQEVGRSDYAINAGATLAFSFNGPADVATGDAASFSWPKTSHNTNPLFMFSGISHLRTGASLRHVEDGTSQTYLAGEKYLDPAHYENGESLGDNESMFSGYCSDNHRFTEVDLTPATDGSIPPDARSSFRFGSAHAESVQMVFCDGSVHAINNTVDAVVHYSAGHTTDAGPD